MKTLYQPFTVGNLTLKNRLVASAMFEYGAEEGRITDKIAERYHQLAQGGIGGIITGMQAVTASGAVAPQMVHTEYDGYVQDMKAIADTVHQEDCKLFVQLQHCGSKTRPAEGYDHFTVSAVEDSAPHASDLRSLSPRDPLVVYHPATVEELRKVAEDFGQAARRCQLAGVDGVQLHCAHGYLINSFLSPSTNHRQDEYGGPIENRARLLFEIYDAVRRAVGPEYPVGVKFPFSDLNAQSIQPEESLYVCRELERRGIDFIEVSSGMVMSTGSDSFSPRLAKDGPEGPFLPYARQVAQAVSVPVISVCGYRSPAFIQQVLSETGLAAVSFGRPLVREPDLPNRWRRDESPAQCVSCNACRNSAGDGIITCQVEKRLKR